MIGYGFMGAAHSYAWRAASMAFDLGAVPVLAVLCGRDRAAVERRAGRFGFEETATDWRAVVERDDIDVIDVCSPAIPTWRSLWRLFSQGNTYWSRSRSPTL